MISTYRAGLIFCLTLMAGGLTAKDIRVSSLDDLRKALLTAAPGDNIILEDGKYEASTDIIISKQGSKNQPITISAATIGGAVISGQGGFNIAPPSAYVVIRGFRFTHSAGRARLSAGTSFCRWTRNEFETPGAGDYLNVSGSDHEIDFNVFRNKNSLGKFIAVRGEGSQIAERLWIHHNYFADFANQGGANGAEALQFGLSGFSLSPSRSVVEHNLFERCHGENELISVKASEVTLRFNTIRDCPAQFTLRHGNRCEVYGNYFFNTPGLRIFGDDHVVHSNYFERCNIGINIGNGGGEVADGDKLTSHDRPDRVMIAFNTMVDNKRNILQTPRKNGLGATSVTLAYNLIVNGGAAAEISGPMADIVWRGNIVFNAASAGDMPGDGFISMDPMLEKDATGIFHLARRSPLKDLVSEEFPGISVDMDGQPRGNKKDAGADEISTGPSTARPLTPLDLQRQRISGE